MLVALFPRVHRRYSSLPLLGGTLEGFAEWLLGSGYPRGPVRRHVRTARRIDIALWERGCRSLDAITREQLRACAPPAGHSRDDCCLASTARCLERYLEKLGVFRGLASTPSKAAQLLDQYEEFLREVRGFARSTVVHHLRTASEFLDHVGYEERPLRLDSLTSGDIEGFVRITGQRLARESLQHEVSHLRSLLRFLAGRGEAPGGLDAEIDTPRVYRGERLPRALPWETVRAFLDSIDRSSPMGLRDYAIFLLIATYGLRAGEIVALTLDDVQWRAGQIRIVQHKTAAPLLLPLMDSVGSALLDYLRGGRPCLRFREIFLRCRAPAGVLKPTAVTEAFQAWSRRSGLKIPFQGPHCLRHSYAVHLLRQGTPLKTIGDVLGHRSAESTCVYLRLAIEDLREVALPLPSGAGSCAAAEVRS